MIIRAAASKDAEQLSILNSIFQEKETTTAADMRKFLGSNSHEIVLVAVADDGEIAGFCYGQPYMSICYNRPMGALNDLFVKENYRGQGIAQKLVKAMEDALAKRGCTSVRLVTGINSAANDFYLKNGYKQASKFNEYIKEI